ncbi:MAG: hypothetical protein KIH08_10995 [Candidatus Freyarchaeota archaeon]|nr:hypothetical protein [Candidatus Jordarchaeia archaeon]MBS7269183.1 hypothetical protein [Candidatus Jordarchaeia archaeon]MBS7279610.1 hypothetical protein [Candidatus Jordarchaeia archaeon]
MSDLKISDFKMFEKAPYEEPDPRVLTELIISGVRGEEKIYGPVFTARVIKHALNFMAQKGEEAPQDIKDLDQLKEYLLSKSDKYRPYCVAMYAQVKAENDLQGQTGAGTRVEMMNMTKKAVELAGTKINRILDIDAIMQRIRQVGVSMKSVASEMGYKKNGDGSVDLIYMRCPFLDTCRLASDEGLLERPDGRARCGVLGEFGCQLLKLYTSYEWDYERLEAYKPHCIVRLRMI